MAKLPPGFEIESSPSSNGPKLPPGFEIESSPTQEMSTGQALWQTAKATAAEDIPGLGPLVGKMRGDLPGAISERLGKAGVPAPISAATGLAIKGVGELLPKTGGELILQAASKPIAKATGIAGSALKSVGKEVMPSLTSAITSIAKPFVKRAYVRSEQVMSAMKNLGDSKLLEGAIGNLRSVFKDGAAIAGKRLSQIEDNLAEKYAGVKIDLKPIADFLASSLDRAGYKVPGIVNHDAEMKLSGPTREILNKLRGLEETGLVTAEGKPALSGTQASFKRAINTKRAIYQAVDYPKQDEIVRGSQEHAILKQAAEALRAKIAKVDPLIERANAGYKTVVDAYDKLGKALSGESENITARLGRMMTKGTPEQKLLQRAESVSKYGKDQLDKMLDMVTASHFKPLINPTLYRSAVSTGGGLAGRVLQGLEALGAYGLGQEIGLGKTLAGGAALGAVTSPRLNLAAIRSGTKTAEAVADKYARLMGNKLARTALPPAATAMALAFQRAKAKDKKK